MEITVLSLAGSLLASVRAEPEWNVSKLIWALKDSHEALWPHLKLVHKGQALEACQKVVELGLFGFSGSQCGAGQGAAWQHSAHSPPRTSASPPPSNLSTLLSWTGRLCSKDDQSYVRTTYSLTVHEDSSFVLERVVSSNLGFVLPSATFVGRLGPEAEFEFDSQESAPEQELDADLDVEATPRGVLLTASFDEVDGGSIRKCITLRRRI